MDSEPRTNFFTEEVYSDILAMKLRTAYQQVIYDRTFIITNKLF